MKSSRLLCFGGKGFLKDTQQNKVQICHTKIYTYSSVLVISLLPISSFMVTLRVSKKNSECKYLKLFSKNSQLPSPSFKSSKWIQMLKNFCTNTSRSIVICPRYFGIKSHFCTHYSKFSKN